MEIGRFDRQKRQSTFYTYDTLSWSYVKELTFCLLIWVKWDTIVDNHF